MSSKNNNNSLIFQELNALLTERKWYNAYLYILSVESPSSDLIEQFCTVMLPLASQIYPLSLTRTVIKITENFEKRLQVLMELENKIKLAVFRGNDHDESLLLLRIAITDTLFDQYVQTNTTKYNHTIEKDIYEYKNMKLNDEQSDLFNKLALKYFESIKNNEESYFYSIKSKNKEKAIKYSLLSKNVYFLNTFDDEPDYYKAVRDGDYEFIMKNKPENYNFLLEKTFIIKIINICRNQKEVNLKELGAHLNLTKIEIMKLIIKACGLDLISGKINGDVLVLSNSSPQSVTRGDLVHIKEQFEAWKDRVDSVIKIME